jgi:mono/diheme cytochrome c family protein
VLPKTTPHANTPTVGVANASPGKQVLGTVPVETDGSAYFRVPAKIGLAFQALDERGQAVQTMRSLTYLQPGESVSCVGCHEQRSNAPLSHRTTLAKSRPPSEITPGPDGSKPLSYPILVQPVLDKHCVSCHSSATPAGKVALTGGAQGRYSVSYNALIGRVSFSSWGGKPGDFRVVNSEPLSQPGFFGARGSALMKLLLQGHHNVALSREDTERLVTWMDANALFYGTFDVADQVRQQRGERIEGPKLE